MEKYTDRYQAGQLLAKHLQAYAHHADAIVLALPRGGVPVGYEIAQALGIPLDILIVRKLGVPGHEELAMGAIASGGAIVYNQDIIRSIGISEQAIQRVIQSEQAELSRRETAYRHDQPFPAVTGKTIILVDDGIATGSTMLAAIKALRQQTPARIVIAVPVAARDTVQEMKAYADDLICPLKPVDLHAVGLWYEDFSQTTDEEVSRLLDQAREQG